LAVIVVGLALIVGCGGSDGDGSGTVGLVGSWTFVKADINSPYVGTLTVTTAMGYSGSITFNANGTFTASGNVLGDGGTFTGTWVAAGNSLTLTSEGDTQSATYSISGSTLSLSTSAEGSTVIAEFSRA
jgi:hypothetical protein